MAGTKAASYAPSIASAKTHHFHAPVANASPAAVKDHRVAIHRMGKIAISARLARVRRDAERRVAMRPAKPRSVGLKSAYISRGPGLPAMPPDSQAAAHRAVASRARAGRPDLALARKAISGVHAVKAIPPMPAGDRQ